VRGAIRNLSDYGAVLRWKEYKRGKERRKKADFSALQMEELCNPLRDASPRGSSDV